MTTILLVEDNEMNKDFRRNAISAIINNMNKVAIDKIEEKNAKKNRLICSSYWFNPVSYIQNQWNLHLQV